VSLSEFVVKRYVAWMANSRHAFFKDGVGLVFTKDNLHHCDHQKVQNSRQGKQRILQVFPLLLSHSTPSFPLAPSTRVQRKALLYPLCKIVIAFQAVEARASSFHEGAEESSSIPPLQDCYCLASCGGKG